MLLPPGHLYTNTCSTPQWSIQPRYMVQGATGDQCTIASLCITGSHLWPSEPEHISVGTLLRDS